MSKSRSDPTLQMADGSVSALSAGTACALPSQSGISDFILPEDYLKGAPRRVLTLPDGGRKLVLHCCCAPCSTAVIECLLQCGLTPLVFFYNPNIYPHEEYETRRLELWHLCKLLNLECVNGDYEQERWQREVAAGLELEGERGQRCLKCFTLRLDMTAAFTLKRGLKVFTTTLATSRWKSKAQVDTAGLAAQQHHPGVIYWDLDWRKGGLVERRYALVKSIGFYNQRYCGCAPSLKSAQPADKQVSGPS